MTTPRVLLRPRDAAKLAGVHVRTLVRWVENGHLSDIRLPGSGLHHRYDEAEILEWLRLSTTPAFAPPPVNPHAPPPDVAAIIDSTDGRCPTCGQDLP